MPDQTPKNGQKGALRYLLAIACLLLVFGVVAQTVVNGISSAFDRSIILAFRDNPSAPIGPAWVQEAARDLTSLGSIIVLVMITSAVTGYLFLARKQGAAWLMLIAVLGGIALSDLLKFAFARPRPDSVSPIAALLARSQSSSKIGLYFIVMAALLTILIGVSRIYLGVHYPTDVLGGWRIGAAWALGCWVLMTWLQHGDWDGSAGSV